MGLCCESFFNLLNTKINSGIFFRRILAKQFCFKRRYEKDDSGLRLESSITKSFWCQFCIDRFHILFQIPTVEDCYIRT